MRGRGLLAFTFFVAATLALLVGLGLWQLQRLEWKEGLIAKIGARTKAPPVSLQEAAERARGGEDVSYLRVSAEGSFDHEKERYLYAISDGEVGWHVIAPLETKGGEVVLVDRGFVPEAKKEPASRPEGALEGTVTVIGLARPAESQGLFAPDNEAAANRWFWRDLAAMAASMFPERKVEVVPFYLEAERGEVPGGWPRGGETRLDIRNDHLQYALTWFLMAFCLVVIYVIYLRGRLRRSGEVAGKGPES
jgi:surfeit locus 1 family protein